MLEVKASGLPFALELWLVLSKGHAPCKIPLLERILFFCQSSFIEIIGLSKAEVDMATLSFVDIAGFKAVLSVCV